MWNQEYWTNEYWAEPYWTDTGGFVPSPDIVSLVIDGVLRNDKLKVNTLSFGSNQENRSMCKFTLVDEGPPPYFRPTVGETVDVFDGTDLAWAGTIDKFSEDEQVKGAVVFHKVAAVDFSQILDRYLVAQIFENELAGDIVKNIITGFVNINGETIGTTMVQDGLLINRVVFGHRKASDCIREMSKVSGFSWYIDQFNQLHFFPRTENLAPFGLSDGSKNYRKLKIDRSRAQYRNVETIIAGQDVTGSRNDEFVGDGTLQTFPLQFPVAEKPTIELNTSLQTVGVRGEDIEADFQWFFKKGEREITQRGTDNPITSTDDLDVVYKGFFPIIVTQQNSGQIALRAATEGGGGQYQHIEDDQSIERRDFAIQKADGLLRRFGDDGIPSKIGFQTDTRGLRAGQLLTVNLPDRGADLTSSTFLIDEVNTKLLSVGNILRTDIKALSGEHLGGWFEFYRKLQEAGRTISLREGEILLLIRNLDDGIELAEVFNTVDAIKTGDIYTGFQWGSGVERRAHWGTPDQGGYDVISGSQFRNVPVKS